MFAVAVQRCLQQPACLQQGGTRDLAAEQQRLTGPLMMTLMRLLQQVMLQLMARGQKPGLHLAQQVMRQSEISGWAPGWWMRKQAAAGGLMKSVMTLEAWEALPHQAGAPR